MNIFEFPQFLKNVETACMQDVLISTPALID